MLDSMRQKLQKRPRGVRGLQIFCIIFLLGNLLFFSTGIFMPKHYKDVEIAPIGTELELGEYTLTITSWDWAEKDRAFEIIFEVKDLSLNREPGYTFRFRCGDSHYRYHGRAGATPHPAASGGGLRSSQSSRSQDGTAQTGPTSSVAGDLRSLAGRGAYRQGGCAASGDRPIHPLQAGQRKIIVGRQPALQTRKSQTAQGFQPSTRLAFAANLKL